MAQKKKFKRRQVFIQKAYQVKFILKFCLIILAGGVLSTVLVSLFSRGTLTTLFVHCRLVMKSTASAILPTIILTNAITLAITTLIGIVTLLYISHKIAGPMFRFEKDMAALKEGDLTLQVFLRDKDQFATLGQGFNEMTAGIRGKVQAISSEVEQLQESAKEQNLPDRVIDDLDHLKQSIHGHFKI